MGIEVYTGVKPAVPRRTLYASILTLLTAALLAAAMTWTRSGADRLAPRLSPEGWSISFRPPSRFAGESGLTKLGQAYQFYGPTEAGVPAALVVYRIATEDNGDAAEICERVLNAYIGLEPPPRGTARVTRLDTKLGSHDAVEVWDRLLDIVVRAVVLGSGDAYAVSAGVHGGPLDADAYKLFDETCASVEFLTP